MSEKINELSIVFPCDESRVSLLLHTIAEYQKFGIPDKVEFILVSRTFKEMVIPGVDIKVVHYTHDGEFFCPSKAFNLGVLTSKYSNVLIGHPEVKPINDVLSLFMQLDRCNYVAKVFDLAPGGTPIDVLYSGNPKEEGPGFYFLAVYRKEDIEAVNGWDMRFMEGYSCEDIDFGQRMANSGVEWSVREDIIGGHQYHERGVCDESNASWKKNRELYDENKANKVVHCLNGLREC